MLAQNYPNLPAMSGFTQCFIETLELDRSTNLSERMTLSKSRNRFLLDFGSGLLRIHKLQYGCFQAVELSGLVRT